jgi:hypothetical protein
LQKYEKYHYIQIKTWKNERRYHQFIEFRAAVIQQHTEQDNAHFGNTDNMGKKSKTLLFALLSTRFALPLIVIEGTHTRKSPNEFGFSLV